MLIMVIYLLICTPNLLNDTTKLALPVSISPLPIRLKCREIKITSIHPEERLWYCLVSQLKLFF